MNILARFFDRFKPEARVKPVEPHLACDAGQPKPQPKAHFNGMMLSNGLPVVKIEFAPGTSTDAIVETTRRIMTNMVGPFSDDSTVENGMVHCRFETSCAAVEKQKKPDGAVDVVWFFHQAPPKDSALMVLLAPAPDRKSAN